ncbi:MAG: DUF2189 domain-containing protein [Pseudomonadota bacterium]
MNPSIDVHHGAEPSFHVNEVTLDHPWQWVAAGWSDFKKIPGLSMLYGLIFFLASLLLTLLVFFSDSFFLVPPLAAGFFLVAPILSVFLYDASRKLEKGESASFSDTCKICSQNSFNMLVMGVILMLAMIFWMMIANLVFAIFFSGTILTFDDFLPTLFLSGRSPAFLAAGILSGGVIALVVFVMTVISIPMLVDRDISAFDAIATSYHAAVKNPRPLLLWASLIVMFVCIGIVTFYLSFIVSMPVIGYATWHAYRDLVAA